MQTTPMPPWWPSNPIAAIVGVEIVRGGPMDKLRVSALRRADTPIALRITWPMPESRWEREPESETSLADTVRVTCTFRPADTSIIITAAWWSHPQLEGWITETAWALGAGYLYRWSNPPYVERVPGAPVPAEHDFGRAAYVIMGDSDIDGRSAPDDVIAEARLGGYWEWECNSGYRKREIGPIAARIAAKWLAEDPARAAHGGRESAWPGWDPADPYIDLPTQFEVSDEPDLVLCIPRALTTRRFITHGW